MTDRRADKIFTFNFRSASHKFNKQNTLVKSKVFIKLLIEGIKLEYGIIENCKIDTNLMSKIWRRVTSKKNDGNIEFSIDLFNINSKNGVKRSQTGS